MNAKLLDAMNRSQSHNEIVTCEFAGDEAALVAELYALNVGDSDVNSVRENDGTIDVWGSQDDTPEEMDWRLKVTLTD